MEKIIEKAGVLVEALPYIRKFRGRRFVIKFGGSILADESLKETIIQDIVFLSFVGVKPVVVHGGGPGINEAMKKAGKAPRFINGLRVTDAETVAIVEDVLLGKENREIAGLIEKFGGRALTYDGRRGGIKAGKISGELGYVGKILRIEDDFIRSIVEGGEFIPVIAPMGSSEAGEVLNINADETAAEVAVSLASEKIVLITDVEGITKEDGAVYSTLKAAHVDKLIKTGVIRGGMIPKVNACVSAIERGVAKAHMVNGNIPHALLLEIFTDEGIGSEIIK